MLLERSMNSMVVKEKNEMVGTWEILAQIPFDSNRKRMTVIVKNPFSSEIMLLTKGADVAILPMIR